MSVDESGASFRARLTCLKGCQRRSVQRDMSVELVIWRVGGFTVSVVGMSGAF
jgi:hypothetical protein